MSISMDTYGPGIDPYTNVIPPNTVLTHASDYDSNIKSNSNSNSNYEPEYNDENILEEKELLSSTSIYYASPEAFFLLRDWEKLHMTVLWSKKVFVMQYTTYGHCYTMFLIDMARHLKIPCLTMISIGLT